MTWGFVELGVEVSESFRKLQKREAGCSDCQSWAKAGSYSTDDDDNDGDEDDGDEDDDDNEEEL